MFISQLDVRVRAEYKWELEYIKTREPAKNNLRF